MNMNADTGCILCGSKKYRVVHVYREPDQYELAVGVGPEGYSRKWVRCEDCGLHYSRYSRPEQALDQIYVSTYRTEKAGWRGSTTEEIFERIISLPPEQSETKYRIAWIKSQISSLRASGMVKLGAPPYRLLDIGGATGVFAYEFSDQEWQPHIVDPSKDGLFLQSKFGIPYSDEYYKPKIFGDSFFDLISLVFVLEHHRDPISLLNLVRKDMDENSLLYIEVPDELCFRHKPAEDDIFNSCHLWMFSPVTLVNLLNICGFEAFSMRRTRIIRGHYSLMMLGSLK